MSAVKLLRQLSTLQLALAVSVLLHAAVLAVRFAAPEQFNRVFQDTPLEVILVNARSNDKPTQAQAIAQSSLAGGGERDKGRATSPLPPAPTAQLGDALQDEEEHHIESLKEQQNQLMAQLRQQLASLPIPDPQAQRTPDTVEREKKRQALIRALAEIEKRVNEENARPRKRYISPATREEVYAVYYDALRHKIEERGTSNFPTLAGRKLYGELTMLITVNHTGQVLDTEVVQSSSNTVLDRQAQAIVRGLRFERFNKAMRRRADQIVVVSRFKFTRDEVLHTQITTQP